jgi:hypothetical protein
MFDDLTAFLKIYHDLERLRGHFDSAATTTTKSQKVRGTVTVTRSSDLQGVSGL